MTINTNKLNIVLKSLATLGVIALFLLVPSNRVEAVTFYHTNQGGSSGSSNSSNDSNSSTTTTRPVITTESARDVSFTKALLQGTVKVTSGTASVWFEYGTRVSSLDHSTSTQTLTVGSTGASEIITNLASNTTYYFRIVARNEHGTSFGSVKNFTTKAFAVAPSTTTTTKTTATTNTTSSTNKTPKTLGNTFSNFFKPSSNPKVPATLSVESNQTASAASSGSGFIPHTFGGWILLVLIIFGIVVLARMIAKDFEERKARQSELKPA